jgi:hypothetical protein
VLRRNAGGNVRILSGPLSYDDVLSLYASADVYVSLHRAEGLGLGMLEAMVLGKPVIATAYSGNMDFMDGSSSMLIDYVMTPVTPSPAYAPSVIGEHQMWAEPSIDMAAAGMRRLQEDPDLRTHLGDLAAAKASEVNAKCASGAVFAELCQIAGESGAGLSTKDLRAWTAPGRRNIRRRRVVSILRAMHLKPPAPANELPITYPIVTGPEGLDPRHD